jgi:uncharacterized membrane protein YgcG
MSIKALALMLATLAAIIAAGLYAALLYYSLADLAFVLGVAAACGVVALIGRIFGHSGRGGGGSDGGAGWTSFDGGGCGGSDGGGCGS